MTDNPLPADDDRAVASTRTLEIAVASILFAVGAIVVFDSYRLGSNGAATVRSPATFPFISDY